MSTFLISFRYCYSKKMQPGYNTVFIPGLILHQLFPSAYQVSVFYGLLAGNMDTPETALAQPFGQFTTVHKVCLLPPVLIGSGYIGSMNDHTIHSLIA